MLLRSARNLNDPGSNPHPGVFKINLVFFSLLQTPCYKKMSKFKKFKVSGAVPVFSHLYASFFRNFLVNQAIL